MELLKIVKRLLRLGTSKKYVITWRSKLTGKEGRGTRLFSKTEVEALIIKSNCKYFNIKIFAVLGINNDS